MADVRETVKEQTRLFMGSLPSLLVAHRGKWVVFREGAVQSEHNTQNDAFKAAVAKFGLNGGFVVAEVRESIATPVTAGVIFGLAG